MTATFTPSDLAQFTGTEAYYRTSQFVSSLVHTDGVEYLVQHGAAWTVDVIASYQAPAFRACSEFQVWEFTVNPDKSCSVKCTDGNDNVLKRQHVDYTDLPCDLRYYCQLGSIDGITPTWVIMLPSEY